MSTPNLLTRRLALLGEEEHRALLGRGLRGIERETLRVDGDGHLAATPHPVAVGSALTHPQITTDYAEALMEFITPAEHDIQTVLTRLDAIHRYVYARIDGEMLWSQSMPCELPPEPEIEIANYGSSNIGMLKNVYRRGLALRYGKTMQCIAGIHYNYSLPEELWRVLLAGDGIPEERRRPLRDVQSEGYIATIRNFRRYSWLLMYLFGASPALARSFLRDRQHALDQLSPDTLYLPYATSLRMSDLGYQNDAQAGLTPHENSLESYVRTLMDAVNRPYGPYAALGTKRDGEWIQLNTNVLQIENEYYSTIRPKRVIRTGERAVQALCNRGVQYIEVRCMDIDPFEPVGISLETGRFLDVFLLFCALSDSPMINDAQSQVYAQNFARTVKEGRRPGLTLSREGEEVTLRQWGEQLIDQLRPVALLLDDDDTGGTHMQALEAQLVKLADPEKTPSARVLAEVKELGSFAAFGQRMTRMHAQYFRDGELMPVEEEEFAAMAQQSLAEQLEIERSDTMPFDDFVAAYNLSRLCCDNS